MPHASRAPLSLALVLLAVAGVATAPSAATRPIAGVTRATAPAVRATTADLMARPFVPSAAVSQARLNRPELEGPERDDLPQAPGARAEANYPPLPAGVRGVGPMSAQQAQSPQVPTVTFNGASLVDTGSFPPDVMGTVGPSQFVVAVNGRLRSFNKTTGVADGVLNLDMDAFFAPVMTPVVSPVVLNFTSDPVIRYDRLSGRWFVIIIDVPCTNATCTTTAANRLLIAMSDAASSAALTPATVWTYFWFNGDASNFLDYPSLGVDANALYIGGNMFTGAGSFVGCNGYVVRKSSLIAGGPAVVTTFANMATASVDGPYAPRGVDNLDPASNEGYFIGVSVINFSLICLRRVSNPGGVPTISSTISLAVATTTSPAKIDHSGNTGGTNGRVDALDDRLFAAHLRNGRLWTAHNFRVGTTGVASTAAAARVGIRWYELAGIRSADGSPSVVQSGTIFDNAATLAAARQFSIPSVMVNGQGHVAVGYTTGGTPYHLDAGTVGRLASDVLGTMQSPITYTATATAYNPASDPGGASGRRWGDYSYTSLDPLDDMTMWTIQEYCDATNSYGCRAAKLPAPPPATPASIPAVEAGHASVVVTLTGTVVSGSGFYDPGANLAAPALPFSHVSATVSGGAGTPPSVNAVTYVDPTHLQLDLNTLTATPTTSPALFDVTVTNPDGQQVTGSAILQVDAAAAGVGPGGLRFRLDSVVPNPTSGSARIAYTLGAQAHVHLSVLDVEGREVARLADGTRPAGTYDISWDGARRGQRVAAGIYFIRFRAGGVEQVRRLAVTR